MANEECRIEDYLLLECDHYGKCFSICFRIPPDLWREVRRLLKAKEFPFETNQDLYRWAFYRGIRSLAAMTTIPTIPMLDLPLKASENKWPDKNGPFFIKLYATVVQLRALGYGPRRLRRFADAIEELIQCMPATHHRGMYLTQVKRIWKFYLVSSAELKARRYEH